MSAGSHRVCRQAECRAPATHYELTEHPVHTVTGGGYEFHQVDRHHTFWCNDHSGVVVRGPL